MEMYNTNFNELLSYMLKNMDNSSVEHKIINEYLEYQKQRFAEEYEDSSRPFLTVVTRTQGNRPDMLTETLLCLTAQSNTDFEYIIAGHNLSEEQNALVTGLIDELPQWMKEKTRLLPVNGGTRTTPLIKAFEAARGKYIAVLDDDDIVFDNWVDTFYQTAKIAPGKVLHSYAVHQDWEIVNDKLFNTPISVSSPRNTFCLDFNILEELTMNVCPLMTLAFPAYAYKVLGINFDETLTTTEDWDFLMRTAFVCGVENNPTITTIYRNWLNAENSQTLHNRSEWEDNYRKIVSRYKKLPIVLGNNNLNKFICEKQSSISQSPLNAIKLYYDCGKDFQESKTLYPIPSDNKAYAIAFDFSGINEVKAVRIDPNEVGGILLKNIEIMVKFSDGSVKNYSKNDLINNGLSFGNSIVYLTLDPQFWFSFESGKKIDLLYINFSSVKLVPYRIAALPVYIKASNLFVRAINKFKRTLKK